MSNSMKITVVGDGFIGKTCMLVTYISGKFPEEYVPTVFENHVKEIVVDGFKYNVTLWDTAGQEDYERLRPLSYPHTSCFLICFAINSETSYENVVTKWAPELKFHKPDTPIVLVGTKIDLREDPSIVCLAYKDGKKLKKKINASDYVECSALNMIGLDDVFESAVRSAICKRKSKKPACTLL